MAHFYVDVLFATILQKETIKTMNESFNSENDLNPNISQYHFIIFMNLTGFYDFSLFNGTYYKLTDRVCHRCSLTCLP